MAKAQNKVIAGANEGKDIIIATFTSGKGLKKEMKQCPIIALKVKGFSAEKWEHIKLTSEDLIAYEIVTDEHMKSAVSGVARGLVGGALLGPVGMIAAISAKNKGIYRLAIEYKSGEKSLIEVDEKIYKLMVEMNYAFEPSESIESVESDVETGSIPVEELQKLKGLLDQGIITQEDFEEKKRQLLGI